MPVPFRLGRRRSRFLNWREGSSGGPLVAVVAPKVLLRALAYQAFDFRIHDAGRRGTVHGQGLGQLAQVERIALPARQALRVAEDDRRPGGLLQATHERHGVRGPAEELDPLAFALPRDLVG